MNCIGCGTPNIHYEFRPKSKETERTYLCEQISCYYEFMEIYQLINEGSHSFLKCIETSIGQLNPIKFRKTVKNFGDFEIFREEIEGRSPKDFFNNDKIIEFYSRNLNNANENQEAVVLGPITIQRILAKTLSLASAVQLMGKSIEKAKLWLIIFRNESNDLEGITIRAADSSIQAFNPQVDRIKKSLIVSSLVEIFQEAVQKNYSNLEFLKARGSGNNGFFFCSRIAEWLKLEPASQNIEKQEEESIINLEEELMNKIKELVDNV